MLGLLSPSLALGAVLSTACAAFFHLWDKSRISLWQYLWAAWLGFAGGNFFGDLTGVYWVQVGHLSVLNGIVGSTVALLIAKSLEA